MRTFWMAVALLAASSVVGSDIRSAAPAGAEVYFIAPADGDSLPTTFTVRFGLKGMGVAPAGIDMADTGHHHLLIDTTEIPNPELPLPATDQVIHFGKGQTETEVTLPAGVHTLRLVVGNHLHVPHNPPVASNVITVTVQ